MENDEIKLMQRLSLEFLKVANNLVDIIKEKNDYIDKLEKNVDGLNNCLDLLRPETTAKDDFIRLIREDYPVLYNFYKSKIYNAELI